MAGKKGEPEFFTTDEVAARLRCSPRHVRYLIKQGDLGAVRFSNGGRWLVPISSYHRYVSQLLEEI
jgi:excisionase family DNA binding protein